MKYNGIPEKQGLYDPRFEHDACGMGFITNIKGKKSHRIVHQALEILVNLSHRGATGSEANTGDGAGILIQLPHNFFAKETAKLGFSLPSAGEYGVGMVFLPRKKAYRKKYQAFFNKIIEEEGQQLLGWRDVPVDDSGIGNSARECMPHISQVFIGRNDSLSDDMVFERKLYVIGRRAEKEIKSPDIAQGMYLASISHRTIVYKGMLMPEQVEDFFLDLSDPNIETAIALVHSRFSTNTFPSWERAHPNRYIIHNGEINTMRGNVNWMNARQSMMGSELFGDDLEKIFPVINPAGSDSAMFDNSLEFLRLTGRSLPHAVMMMIPEPWENNDSIDQEKKSFYEYHSCLMEPWDGPAAMAFTDGIQVGAVLDRNGLRPSRYYVTSDDLVVLASEVGVVDLPEEKIISKQRLEPGKMLLIDTSKGKIINDQELKKEIAGEYPYDKWLDENLLHIDALPAGEIEEHCLGHETLVQKQRAFDYTYEEIRKILIPMAENGVDPVGAMGNDTALAVLSDKPQLLYNYFKQLFAQVTNPPIDSIREAIITATRTNLGSEGNLLNPGPESCRQITLPGPVLDNAQLAKLLNLKIDGFKTNKLPILFKIEDNGRGLEEAMEKLFAEADRLIDDGVNILVLSDKGIDRDKAPIPALLAVAGLHHHLIRTGRRTSVSLVLESGEPREVHHFCLLLGYGLQAVNPYLVFKSLDDLIKQGLLETKNYDKAVKKYIKAATKGIVKVMAKMGISTVQSYRGAQIFEALGLNDSVIDRYFTGTPSRIGGIGLAEIARETIIRHQSGFNKKGPESKTLESGSTFTWRKDGEKHLYNPETIYLLQRACREGNYDLFKEYTSLINNQAEEMSTLRGLLGFNYDEAEPIPLEEVEPVESICKRFKTGAMSYGSISKEAHETLAIAMNRIGGKSNTGEGGEDPERFTADPNGDSRCSAIKQVASGRFGVTSYYLTNAREIQIKMAQGAKPGEGGQLPGKKVYPWIAKVRGTTPGVGLISPPPHHDIYSIEDLAELIHDLKNANRDARINVKLVSEVGVGTIAAGVAKGKADVILISGYDGGTGASPRTSIKHAGLPWELGLAETHQTLVLNKLRSRVKLETDGKLMSGKDLAVAALLGAEEYGFATAPLVVMGCVMMRVCNLDTCPVGVATQNPELRKRFAGKVEHIVNFMHFIAREMREEMARLGFRTVDEMIGRVDKLKRDKAFKHWKAKGLDYSKILYQPEESAQTATFCQIKQDHDIEESMDMKELLQLAKPALDKGEKVEFNLKIKNTDRVVGTILGNELTKKYGAVGLPDDTIKLNFAGSAGQSFGAYIPQGITLTLQGDSNDYIGKGLSGGKIIVKVPEDADFSSEDNIVVGNVAFFGATSGEAYIQGVAGERFCVRNSGVHAVVEGVGDHGCEYMTGGRVVILGKTGRNFAAGMSGGVAYVFDWKGNLADRTNQSMVELEPLEEENDINFVKEMIKKHLNYTGSSYASKILDNWSDNAAKFVRVMPRDYKRMIDAINSFEKEGLKKDEALMAAFEQNNSDAARVSGN
ncbi:MAG: glutamate synthase large subunit [Firmicutes bacterium]|nr:glutamate synthase large subunit [Bacillota bacterium]